MNTICLVLDRCHAGYLGPYGNAWIETPSIDRLAAESFLFDQCFLDCPELDSLYRSYWLGGHPLHQGGPPVSRLGLPAMLAASGLATTLITDDPAVAASPASGGFGLIEKIEPSPGGEVAEEISQTHLARCFARVVDGLGAAREPFFSGVIWPAWARFGTRRWNSASTTTKRATRSHPSRPRFPRGFWERILIPTKCSAISRPTPGRSR